jgi:tRNA (adenine37-N6)-methyltransferase
VSSEIFTIKPIGIIRSPFRDVEQKVPIQGALAPETRGTMEVYREYEQGLKDIEGFSHLFILYLFHHAPTVKLTVVPYIDTAERGVFATRSPHRPNHIGLALARLVRVEGNILTIAGLDMVDGTPVIDIKPYNPAFDNAAHPEIGWMTPYFRDGKEPRITATESSEQWNHE